MNRAELMIRLKYALRFLPDSLYVKLYFRLTLKRKLDLKNPVTLNEKLQWMKFNDRNPLYSMVSDKFAVRPYIQEQIGEKYLVPIIGHWNSFNEINFDILPEKFVLKCNHDSGGLVICKSKKKLDKEKARKKINKSLKRKFYYIGREWQYRSIKPMIIAEKLLLDKSGNPPADYKISCFNGKVDNIMVCTGRFSKEGVKFYFFDKNWNFLRYNKGDEKFPENFTIEEPENLDEMIKVAEKLSKPFSYARIDLYNLNGKVYFSEITLSPNSGFDTDITYSTDKLLGNKLHIPYAF
ncbi:ATP-grasp fold amidoligase family protein [Clostridium perfringens]|uniref:ATP-grasp fold amidoligase family protein n=1 Tax=Clostridium perfringens TaxID=1502 RepID=UPI000D717850|nr:ATP-grasp fold amidoligase family protein [Clostridium perfringens]MDU4074081.1 ATP-grasp fold amidoligase family protein [Clostridium perfringens]PWX64309.1 glycosyl transferase [Clostridium perfringens]